MIDLTTRTRPVLSLEPVRHFRWSTPTAGHYEPALIGEDHRLNAIPHSDLGQDPVDMGLDRCLRQEEGLGYLDVGEPACDELQNIYFTLGQRGEPLEIASTHGGSADVGLDEASRDGW